jgi:hypothetical protein
MNVKIVVPTLLLFLYIRVEFYVKWFRQACFADVQSKCFLHRCKTAIVELVDICVRNGAWGLGCVRISLEQIVHLCPSLTR